MDPEGFPGALFRAWEPRMALTHHPVPAAGNVAPNPNVAAAAASAAPDAAVAGRGGGGAAAAALDHHHHHHHHHQLARAFEFGFTSTAGPGGSPLPLGSLPLAPPLPLPLPPPPPRRRDAKTLDDLFKDYGVRITTLAKMAEMGFTVQTLVNMTDQELEDVIKTMLEAYHVELLVGEKYGIKAAIRAERKHLEDDLERQKPSKAQQPQQQHLPRAVDKRRRLEDQATASKEGPGKRDNISNNSTTAASLVIPDGTGGALVMRDALLLGPQQQQHLQEIVTGAGTSIVSVGEGSDSERKRHGKKKQKRKRPKDDGEDGEEDRPREHPFIVTEPGELARGKKNGLDYLFDLYEQCGKYLDEVQQQCKERGEKCPTKVTNQVFRHAKHRGASYINKPKMRHYVHCYALHCLDLEQSNRLRKVFKDRGENVGAWRQACYYPLVEMARNFNWDIEGVFSRNEKLRIWYVPTRLRQLCHLEKSKED